MKILLANDDGIASKGIQTLAKVLSEKHDVYVAAPDGERSSYSHSVTYWRLTNTAEEVRLEGVKKAWAVSGTPADCIYYGINAFMKEDLPDLVISGINKGENLTTDVIYSGTLGAAQEGIMMGIPAMAVSLCSFESDAFEDAARIAMDLIDPYMNDPMKMKYVCSINVPALMRSDIKGIRVTHFDGMKDFRKDVKMTRRADGKIQLDCYNTLPELMGLEHSTAGDYEAVQQGYVSVTPVGLDYVSHDAEAHIKDWEKISF
ncbi:MAG: 5'/3'-nucleotidase SurE [Solobacterium sp.]|jgi:5'-nucleotidase|nr:5'/3'-nucleotidase SurE [Solobacterium sp.]MCH4048161.1 5'/3'-nucleotidase SurE [Solobacterium sp.]MCH4074985.1 5'/3'-nucleotidase SurE [Solobacterium sp.]MCI1313603.1 5'/3'-nucleotidase SurE [Solobacterium sp.]MCI1345807.1 5'/3'-nucleotidase SurE [Solobacterium sp.]